MCGIAGLMAANGHAPDEALLNAMAKAMVHRGPDGQSITVADDVGLVHTRLSIIDLEHGDQPFTRPEGPRLIANGEIYNDLDLRAALAGQTFQSGSDCEPPLHLYMRDGANMVAHLRGMYGLALHDPRDGTLLLVRDPFGIKPLYVAQGAHGLAFASEISALRAAGFGVAKVQSKPRAELLQLQFTTGTATILEGIERLLPGEWVKAKDGKIIGWGKCPAFAPAAADLTDEEAYSALDAAFMDSVDHHQRADVPYGMFLSGGIDSSALLAAMARLNENPVMAFTAGFSGTAVADERAHARMLAETVGAKHVELDVTADDFFTHLPAIAAAMDDPVADYAIVPTWLLAREARKHVTVILSGEGGDELFGGYGRYRHAMRPWPFTKKMRRKGTFDGLGVLTADVSDWRAGIAAAEKACTQGTRLTRAQQIDMADWLPHDLLTKLDRCLMAHSLEGRVPFLDPKVSAIAARLSDAQKVQGRTGKWLLRQWLDQALPQAKPFAKKKGFTVPVGDWIASQGAQLGPLVAHQTGVADIADKQAVVDLFANLGTKQAGFAAWTLLFYALWHQHHVVGVAANGAIADVLAAA